MYVIRGLQLGSPPAEFNTHLPCCLGLTSSTYLQDPAIKSSLTEGKDGPVLQVHFRILMFFVVLVVRPVMLIKVTA